MSSTITDRQQGTWGTGAFGPLPGGTGNLAIYYIGMQRNAASFQQDIEDTTRHSFGVRIWRIGRTFDYDEEIIVQNGRFGGGPIRAWAFASEQGITPPRLPGRTRVGVRAFVASGDRDPSDATLESFDPLFPGIAYSGKASLIGPTNLIAIGPSLAVSPHERVRLTSDWATLWRTSRNDGLYGINVSLLQAGVATNTRHVGSQGTAEVDVRVSRHITVWGSITGFRTGTFLRSSPRGENVRYVAAHLAYRF
jgi:hypothetical protein